MSRSFSFAAALFVGGHSTRMGSDKAVLAWRGQTFLELQLATLRGLSPARLFLSTRETGASPANDVEVVPDLPPYVERGPLGGLFATLSRTEAAGLPLLLTLAVDMPRMTSAWLASMIDAGEGSGLIPELSGGQLEPLAALWPVTLLPEISAALDGNDASLHRLARRGIEAGKLATVPVSSADEALFLNVNRKSDFESLESK